MGYLSAIASNSSRQYLPTLIRNSLFQSVQVFSCSSTLLTMHIATILSAAALISSTAFANPDELDKKEAVCPRSCYILLS